MERRAGTDRLRPFGYDGVMRTSMAGFRDTIPGPAAPRMQWNS
jgi:hypothetical protein